MWGLKMPQFDVSDILNDTDFLDCIVLTRNVQTVDNNGNATNTAKKYVNPYYIDFYGVVTQGGGERLDRGEAGERNQQTITIVTRHKLTAGRVLPSGEADSADVVTWNGNRYTVVQVDDYSRYGMGFIQAVCELLTLTG